MDWLPAVNTVIGATIGIAATSFAERARWKRESAKDWKSTKLAAYSRFLLATARAVENMRLIALQTHSDGSARDRALQEAFRSAEMLEARFEIITLASTRVAETANLTYRRARDLRSILMAGSGPSGAPYRETLATCYASLRATASEMRKDLGLTELDFIPFGLPPEEGTPDPPA
ncbi:hypothetical protein I6A84_32290 [Frankia sp. CNm7]|uniref:Uncharacterized protein n=1 Tax=Frankia nepalensis TaxID=1836974 RepID=A0A937UV19_9ACTN|nr:hypothetical protein [Frankia nepalensis]MBL7500271.1 hypothetical protein [Frankia nepalensis]MBL7511972.1 hypothetical protein [Frankia nepalensis]MBL7522642.1 hypothetical protein [Frankia nepalensis]MBL7631786.1 hypothetical protein [Frankia nepalensis]